MINRSSENKITADELISIAQIARPHGIKGEVVAEILTDFPDRFSQLDNVFLSKPTGSIEQVSLINYRFHQDRVILKFEGINDRNQAELLRGVVVKIPATELMELPADNYYEFDLIGCQVVTDTGVELGQVAELMHTGAAPLLVVRADQTEYLIPFAEDICHEIDTNNKRIVISPPEGLLDL